jgi:flagellum-specific peptidoglycan hydrolase FlgJ
LFINIICFNFVSIILVLKTNKRETMQDVTINITAAFRKHWFKVLVVGLILYIYVRKDFSFQFRVSEKKVVPIQQQQSGTKYTQQTESKAELSVLDGALQLFGNPETDKHTATLDAVPENIQLQYVKRFGKVAIQEQKKYGIPASVTLGMALLQSAAGTSSLSVAQNNHFGMVQPDGTFRSYTSAWASFRDHSIWASQLAASSNMDYKAWTIAISKASGRGEDYTAAIINMIDENKLFRLDACK